MVNGGVENASAVATVHEMKNVFIIKVGGMVDLSTKQNSTRVTSAGDGEAAAGRALPSSY
jgi:hypothetical protein